MKNDHLLFSLFVLSCLCFSCQKSNITYEEDYDKSYNVWQRFKAKVGNSYRYTAAGGSWVGIGWQTVLTVTEGNVVERDFTYVLPVNYSGNIPADSMSWKEDENHLNTHTHTQTPAAATLTLDQVYEKARTEWLVKKSNTTNYFEAKNDGLISECGYSENGCQDDCFIGISITNIQGL